MCPALNCSTVDVSQVATTLSKARSTVIDSSQSKVFAHGGQRPLELYVHVYRERAHADYLAEQSKPRASKALSN